MEDSQNNALAPSPAPKPEPASLPAPVSRPVAPKEEPVVPIAEPKRFVRTFATDMEALKSGKLATLTPAAPKPAAKPEPEAAKPAEADVVQQAANILPAMAAAPLSQPIAIAEPAAPKPASAPAPSAPPPPPPAIPAVQKPGPSPIQTYQGDFARRLKDSNASKATIIAAEQDAGGPPTAVASEPLPRSSVLYLVAGGILLVASAAGGYFAYTHYLAQNEPVFVALPVSAPIFVDEREAIRGTGSTLMQAIEQSATRMLPPNAVRLLYTEQAKDSVFVALELPAPGILLRNTKAEGSMAGIVNSGSAQSPFFIVSVTSYGSTLSGMLAWEARMATDLKFLFPPLTAAGALATTTATTTAQATTTPTAPPDAPAGVFRDAVIANHDARIYTDDSGASLVYGYWDQKTLIIARDAAAFTTIVSRLATSRKQ